MSQSHGNANNLAAIREQILSQYIFPPRCIRTCSLDLETMILIIDGGTSRADPVSWSRFQEWVDADVRGRGAVTMKRSTNGATASMCCSHAYLSCWSTIEPASPIIDRATSRAKSSRPIPSGHRDPSQVSERKTMGLKGSTERREDLSVPH